MPRLVALVLAFLMSACSSGVSGVGGIPGVAGLTYEEAVDLAREQVGPQAELLRAEAGGVGDFDAPGEVLLPDEPRDRLVWAVWFRDRVPVYCPVLPTGQPAPPCEDMDAEIRVVLDYLTGEFLYSAVRGID